MFGSNSAFGSSDSADTDMIKSSESESDADTGESDEEDHPVTDLSLGKPFKSIYECAWQQLRVNRESHDHHLPTDQCTRALPFSAVTLGYRNKSVCFLDSNHDLGIHRLIHSHSFTLIH
jgi:hypothetical protein